MVLIYLNTKKYDYYCFIDNSYIIYKYSDTRVMPFDSKTRQQIILKILFANFTISKSFIRIFLYLTLLFSKPQGYGKKITIHLFDICRILMGNYNPFQYVFKTDWYPQDQNRFSAILKNHIRQFSTTMKKNIAIKACFVSPVPQP